MWRLSYESRWMFARFGLRHSSLLEFPHFLARISSRRGKLASREENSCKLGEKRPRDGGRKVITYARKRGKRSCSFPVPLLSSSILTLTRIPAYVDRSKNLAYSVPQIPGDFRLPRHLKNPQWVLLVRAASSIYDCRIMGKRDHRTGRPINSPRDLT